MLAEEVSVEFITHNIDIDTFFETAENTYHTLCHRLFVEHLFNLPQDDLPIRTHDAGTK